ncbi:unnamed protein product [Rotaria sordida]|uniref:C2HC/C3H-type domain-containing protein n=1 Tax=Rotaria sordida TaxID=392033 RepID=A0A814QYX7_9BILA|nr:unnamed protein product [Rotaria sordida]
MYGVDKNSFVESSYQVNDDISIPIYADVQLYPCSNCGRNFNTESLRKHQPICRKTSQKQPRKVFDTGKQRATDSDVPYTATKETTQFYNEGIKPKQNNQKKRPSNWREGHNALVRTIREARQITQAMETGAPLPKQTPSQIPSDYVQCEYCQRHFNKHSAERHIPFCETQHKRKQMQYAAAANNTRNAGGSLGRQGRAYQQQYSFDSPKGSANKQHQINSAPSTFASRRPQKTNDEKDYRRPPLNPNAFKKTHFGETSTNNINGTPPKYGSYRTTKTRSATGTHLPGMMRTGRTIENGDLNIMAATGRGQQKPDASPQMQRRATGLKTRSPSPARRPPQVDGFLQQQQQQQQKTRVPTAAKHCHECGEAFPVEWAKFCCECGAKRLGL